MKHIPDQSITFEKVKFDISEWLKKYDNELCDYLFPDADHEEIKKRISFNVSEVCSKYLGAKDRYKKLEKYGKKIINDRESPHDDLIIYTRAMLEAYRKSPYPLDNNNINESLSYKEVYFMVEKMLEHLEWHSQSMAEKIADKKNPATKEYFAHGELPLLSLVKAKERLARSIKIICSLYVKKEKYEEAFNDLLEIVCEDVSVPVYDDDLKKNKGFRDLKKTSI